jgi:hypothetical protein
MPPRGGLVVASERRSEPSGQERKEDDPRDEIEDRMTRLELLDEHTYGRCFLAGYSSQIDYTVIDYFIAFHARPASRSATRRVINKRDP